MPQTKAGKWHQGEAFSSLAKNVFIIFTLVPKCSCSTQHSPALCFTLPSPSLNREIPDTMTDPQLSPKPRQALRYAIAASLLGLLAVVALIVTHWLTTMPEATATATAETSGTATVTTATAAAKATDATAAARSPATPNSVEAEAWPRNIVDGRGDLTQLPRPPQRIFSLAPNATQILRAIGADAMLVAIALEGSDPAEAPELTKLSVYPAPSAEAVLALQPDIIIGADITSTRVASRLRGLGLKVIILNSTGYDGILEDIRRAGSATGTGDVAQIVVEALQSVRTRVEKSRAAASTQHPAPSALLFLGGALEYAAGGDSYTGDLLQIAGAHNLAETLPQAWPLLSTEFILKANPQVLIFSLPTDAISFAPLGVARAAKAGEAVNVVDAADVLKTAEATASPALKNTENKGTEATGAETTNADGGNSIAAAIAAIPPTPADAMLVGTSEALSQRLREDPIWGQLQAVRSNRIYAIDQNLLNVPGPHVGEALLQLHAIVLAAQQSLAAQ